MPESVIQWPKASAVATMIMNAKPEAVDLASSPPGDAGILVKQLRQAGFEGPIGRLGGPGYSEISRVAGGDDVLKDFYWYEPVIIDEKTLQIAEDYKKLIGSERPENNLFFQWVSGARMAASSLRNSPRVACRGRPMRSTDRRGCCVRSPASIILPTNGRRRPMPRR